MSYYDDWIHKAIAFNWTFTPRVITETYRHDIITEVEIVSDSRFTTDGTVQKIKIRALWDTGASNSVIDQSIADTLKMIPTGRITMQTASSPRDCNTYQASVSLHPSLNPPMIVECKLASSDFGDADGNRRFDMLIGMDIIGMGDFSIGQRARDGSDNQFDICFSFAFPSSRIPIDFVDKIMRERRSRSNYKVDQVARKAYEESLKSKKKTKKK